TSFSYVLLRLKNDFHTRVTAWRSSAPVAIASSPLSGPCINQNRYEVGPDFEAALLDGCADSSRFLARAEPNSKAHFDLPGFVVSQLDKLGLAQIERQSPCTYVNRIADFSALGVLSTVPRVITAVKSPPLS
ncbi:laccase domain-containing protein, partial [Hyphomicrobium sp. D-2]|uniref:laccase domain-containing protein n=1 Tax=Hyphomicrobium sp. D-2 TaxID=3041621 RepID=UPI002458DC16